MPMYGKDSNDDEAFSRLTFGEQGFYWWLAWWQWNEGSVPADFEEILDKLPRRKVNEARKLWVNVQKFFESCTVADRQRLANTRLESHRKAMLGRRKGFQAGANKTNELRWGSQLGVTAEVGSPSDSPSDDDTSRLATQPSGSLALAVAVAVATKTEKKEKTSSSQKKSSKDLVEDFQIEDKHREWAAKNTPSVPIDVELEAWKDRERANKYTTGKAPGIPVADPQAAFYTAMRNAERWGTYRNGGSNGNGTGRSETARVRARAASGGPSVDQSGEAPPRRRSAAELGQRSAADLLANREREVLPLPDAPER